MNVLVLRLSALGDVVNTFPAVAGLRRALEADGPVRIGWLVEETAADLVRANRDVDETYVLPRRRLEAGLRAPARLPEPLRELRRLLGDIRAARFDVLLDFQGHLKSGLLGLATGIRRRIGFARGACRELNHLFTTEQAALDASPIPRADKALALVRRLAPHARCAPPRLVLPRPDETYAEALVARCRGDARWLVGIHPGTSRFGAFKRWPAERFGAVAHMLWRTERARCLITWGPGEKDLAEEVALHARRNADSGRAFADRAAIGALLRRGQPASGPPAETAPPMRLTQLAAVLRRLDLFIAADTGPLHLAAVLGTPVVAIFGPKDPVVYRPFGERAALVRRDLPCSPCTRRRCDHVSCLLAIGPDEVFEAARRLLSCR